MFNRIRRTTRRYRVIVRFSLNQDTASAIRNAIANRLTASGIMNTKTGTWESQAMTLIDAAECLNSALHILALPTTVSGSDPEFHLDHLWIYIDKAASQQ